MGHKFKFYLVILVSVVLCACGGGGNDNDVMDDLGYNKEVNNKYAHESIITPEMIDKIRKNIPDDEKKRSDYIRKSLGYGVWDEPQWDIKIKGKNRYKVRVVIVGESVNRDYMNVYGYPVDNTPFLSSLNKGTFYTNVVSPSRNTIQSINRTLQFNEKKDTMADAFSNPHSVITLANKVGLDTFYISNQDLTGIFDTANTNIALRSNYFLNLRQPNRAHFVPQITPVSDSVKGTDFGMLPKLEDALHQNSQRSKVIFLHMWNTHFGGSDASTCSYVEKDKKHMQINEITTRNGKSFDCYLQAIQTVDKFVEQIYLKLKEKNISFSILYFSDHGQQYGIRKEYNPEISFYHSSLDAGHNIPFFIINSDDQEKRFIDIPMSTFNFLDFFAEEWLKISTNFTNPDAPYKLPRQVWWDKLINYDDLKKQPILCPDGEKVENNKQCSK